MNTPTIHKDPVCGMSVDPSKAADKYEYKGVTYYFCSRGCKQAFERDPEKYLGPTKHVPLSRSSH
jgi:YHS domain-containing protein